MKVLRFFLASALFFAAAITVSAQSFAGGDGTSGNPYQVATAAHLNNVRDYRTSHFIQTADIDLSHETGNSGGAYWNGGLGWNPIGATEATSFLGSYNGQGYSITGLTINRPGQHYIGLFAYVGDDIVTPVISNVKLVSVSITSNWVCGALAGKITKATISKCSSTGSVTGVEYMGGLIGWAPSNSTISESYSTCTVTTTGLYTGGFIGFSGSNNTITNCYATGSVTSTSGQTGGFAGRIVSTNLVNCYSTGAVSGSSLVGGLIGSMMTASATNCFWDTETSGQASSAGGTGKTTAQMKTQGTYTGWDFTTVWQISGDYPDLRNNSRLPVIPVYITQNNNDNGANVLYPKVGFGSPITSPFSWTPVSPDWTYNAPKCTVYIVPAGSEDIVATSFVVNYDATKATLSASAGDNNLFDSGIFYTQATGAGRLKVNASNISSAINVTPGSGKYLARLIFTMLKPGHMEITLDSLDFRQYDIAANEQVSIATDPGDADIKFYLGDFASSGSETTGDGLININDLSLFATAYWSNHAQVSTLYKSKFDVGPTNASGNYFALPTADGNINFEDLIIFSVGYGKSAGNELPKVKVNPINVTLGEEIVGNTVRVPVYLSGSVEDVRGLSFSFRTGMTLKGVEKAGELNNENGFVIFRQEGDLVQIDAAVIGADKKAISAEGIVAYLVFENKSSLELEAVIARNSFNQDIPVLMKGNSALSITPDAYALSQNYPNPFNPSTAISFALPQASEVTLKIYNTLGQEVAVLINGEMMEAGVHTKAFDAGKLTSGVYIYKLSAGKFSAAHKMILNK
ncbi:MAG: T9SS type A sorting domain-containing protein [Ignavibacteriales bacterium]|nr:MAG: T9SS type A sorting domain-containing protein [Ignavibacteriales bacterium]